MHTSLFQELLTLPPIAKKCLSALIVFIGFCLLAYIISAISKKIVQRYHAQEAIVKIIARLIRNIIIIIGLISALGTAGVNVGAMIASLGLLGFATGYALKDLLSNLIAGFMIMLNNTVQVGEHIAILNNEGTVAAINLRYTVIHSDDKTLYIPNSTLFSNPLTIYK